MKIKVNLYVHQQSQVAAVTIKQVGDQPPMAHIPWEGYDSYTFTVDVPHCTELPEIEAHEEKE